MESAANPGKGINKDATEQASQPKLFMANGKLHATWQENNGGSQIRVAVYNGNDAAPQWDFFDGNQVNGLNFNAAKNAQQPQMTINGAKVMLTWHEADTSTPAVTQIRAMNLSF